MLIVFSFNASRFTVWEGFSLRWYRAAMNDPQLAEGLVNSVIIAVVAAVLSTVIGTLAAYGIWRRRAPVLSGSLYLSLVTPEIVTGVSLLALFQWAFRFLHLQLGLYTVIVAHVAFSIAYVAIVISARLRNYDRTLEEAAMDLGAGEWHAFSRVTLPVARARHRRRRTARAGRVLRRLRDHQPGRRRGFGNAADGDLRHGAARRESGGQCGFGADRGGVRRDHPRFAEAAASDEPPRISR